jgi:hypothetical protein
MVMSMGGKENLMKPVYSRPSGMVQELWYRISVRAAFSVLSGSRLEVSMTYREQFIFKIN